MIKEVTINGKQVKEILLNGGVYFRKQALPEGYTEQADVYFNGNAASYITLPMLCSDYTTIGVQTTFTTTALLNSGNNYIFGSVGPVYGQTSRAGNVNLTSTAVQLIAGGNGNVLASAMYNQLVGSRIHMDIILSSVVGVGGRIDETEITTPAAFLSREMPNTPFTIGTCYGASQSKRFNGYMERTKIYGDNSVLYDLVPCTRDDDNQQGFYDVVNHNFYPLWGTRTH